MYRAVAAAAIRRGVSPADEESLARLAHAVTMDLDPGRDGSAHLRVDGDDVTEFLRHVEVNRVVAQVAKVPRVREALGAIQRRLGRSGRVVMEGRDIGSVILPDARIKVFLTASIEVRARRRRAELAAAGAAMPLEEVRRIIEEDDRIATTRATAPLRVPPGAVVIDSSALTVDQVVDQIVTLAERDGGV